MHNIYGFFNDDKIITTFIQNTFRRSNSYVLENPTKINQSTGDFLTYAYSTSRFNTVLVRKRDDMSHYFVFLNFSIALLFVKKTNYSYAFRKN